MNGLWWLASKHQSRQKGTDEERRGIIYASHPPFDDDSDTGLAGGLLNWAKARMSFELYGIQTQHLEFCRALSSACRLRFHSRQFRDEAVAMFEPAFSG